MRNYKHLLLIPILAISFDLMAQSIDSSKLRPVDVNFLFTYYDQEGEHAAVTGGKGTEKLTDYAGKLVINVPMDSITQIHADIAINRYSSASTDQIDNNVSSASSIDSRMQLKLAFTKKRSDSNQYFGAHVNGSVESDYISTGLGFNWQISSDNGNREFGLSTQAFFDHWILYFPKELRDTFQASVRTNRRNSYSVSFNYNQIINKRLKISVIPEFIYQKGLLSTPFHRVYFQGQDRADIENLPGHRIKLPVGFRANYFVSDFIVFRSYFRLYWDSFGIFGQTASLTVPLKLNRDWSLYPSYRWHHQSASAYFLPYKEHLLTDEFYTSDFDLSQFTSHKFGLGVIFAPVFGIRFKKKATKIDKRFFFKNISLRLVYYHRSDGLYYYSVNSGFFFRF